jgi:hypothetical protein
MGLLYKGYFQNVWKYSVCNSPLLRGSAIAGTAISKVRYSEFLTHRNQLFLHLTTFCNLFNFIKHALLKIPAFICKDPLSASDRTEQSATWFIWSKTEMFGMWKHGENWSRRIPVFTLKDATEPITFVPQRFLSCCKTTSTLIQKTPHNRTC